MKTIVKNLGFITGSGKSITEAKENLQLNLTLALTGSYTPKFIAYRGMVAFIWRQPEDMSFGWRYKIINQDNLKEDGSDNLYGNYHSDCNEKSIEQRACYHLAQNGWQPEDGTEAPAILHGEEDKRGFSTWAKWQLHYKQLREQGKTDVEAHAMACGY